MKHKGDCKRRRLEQKEASESAAATTMTTTTKTRPAALRKGKMKDPPGAKLKDSPVGGMKAAAPSKDSEILKKLVELLQNLALEEKLLKFLLEELKPTAATATTEQGLNPAVAAAAAIEANAD